MAYNIIIYFNALHQLSPIQQRQKIRRVSALTKRFRAFGPVNSPTRIPLKKELSDQSRIERHRSQAQCGGAGRPMRTSLCFPYPTKVQAAKSCRHSAKAADRFALKLSRLQGARCVLKWLWSEEWTATNFCSDRIRAKRSMACLVA